MSLLEKYFEGIEIQKNPDTGETVAIRPRNPDTTFGRNETACWANLGESPDGHRIKVATGGEASMTGRLANWMTNHGEGCGTAWFLTY